MILSIPGFHRFVFTQLSTATKSHIYLSKDRVANSSPFDTRVNPGYVLPKSMEFYYCKTSVRGIAAMEIW